jgi:signal transduction histidine kinase
MAFEIVVASSQELEDDPEAGRVALAAPLDHIKVVARARELGEDVLRRERTTMKLWLIALSIGGIAAGAVVTALTVLREAKAAELKSDFVTNVTHELRTPLTSIRMFIETLEHGRVEDEAEAKECLQIMGRETDRLTRLIERLLAFSKIESRKWRFKFSYVAPLELVNDAIKLLKRMHGLKDDAPVPIEVESIQALAPIAVDRDAIVETILNLLTNAWKYTPAENRRLRVVLTERRKQVVIDVEDNGIGVPRRDRRRIWKKFERGSNAEKGRIEGSGIGLTLALSIAKGHGGTITLTPLKQGSRFSLVLPKV